MTVDKTGVEVQPDGIQARIAALLSSIAERKLETAATCGLGVGIAAALCGAASVSDYIVAASILTHMACRFERWWLSK